MKYILIIVTTVLIIYWFKKASGTLKPNLINIISYSLYSVLAFEYIGVVLTFLGFSDHYLISKITNLQSITIAYCALSYAMIALPITIFAINKKVFKKEMEHEYIYNLNKSIEYEQVNDRKIMFYMLIVLAVICLISIIYVFICIGYVPLFKYFDADFSFDTERIRISRDFTGNEYIKNLVMILCTPMLSYIAYIYARITKERKWKVLFIILFVMSVLIKTYDFSKAPLIYYICYFFVIEVMLGKTFKLKKMLIFGGVAVLLILMSYKLVASKQQSLLSLSNGPLSRIVMTQAGTLILHFDAFPSQVDYLRGNSFSKVVGNVLNKEDYGTRSRKNCYGGI